MYVSNGNQKRDFLIFLLSILFHKLSIFLGEGRKMQISGHSVIKVSLLSTLLLFVIETNLFSYPTVSSLDYPVPKDKYIPGSHECRNFLTPSNHLGDDINPFGSCPPPSSDLVYKQFEGFPVAAIGNGQIVHYGPATGYGELVVVIEHDFGRNISFTNGNGGITNTRYILSIYGHIRKNKARGDKKPLPWRVGSEIKKGDVIGYINNSSHPDRVFPDPNGDGYEHLHLGIRLDSKKNAVRKDPKWFRGYDQFNPKTNKWLYRGDFAEPSSVINTFIAPYADFIATLTSGPAPLSVQFTDQSTGNITSRQWDFGDGGTSAEQNPSHVYETPGLFSVILTVIGPAGTNTATKQNYIEVTAPLWSGTQQFGATSNDQPSAIAIDNSGNIYITGYTLGNMDGNPNQGQSDIFLVKFDPSGNKKWTQQFGTPAWDSGQGLSIDNTGFIYLSGEVGANLEGNTSSGASDAFLAQFDSNGNRIWTRQFGGPSEDAGFGVAADRNGNIYVTGAFGGEDFYVAKFDKNGNMIWPDLMKCCLPYYDRSFGIAIDGPGNIYITGETTNDLAGTGTFGATDFFLMKLSADGSELWTQQLGTFSYDNGWAIAIDNIGGYIYVTGTTFGGVDGNINPNPGWADVFLVKYDPYGTKVWTRQIGTTGGESPSGVGVDNAGNIYVTGSTTGSLDGSPKSGNWNMFLIKYDPFGNKLWTRQLGSGGDTFSSGVAVGTDRLYITGYFTGILDGKNSNDGNMFLMEFDFDGVKQ
jgi:PKD repeat protein